MRKLPKTPLELIEEAEKYAKWKRARRKWLKASFKRGPEPQKQPKERHRKKMRQARNRRRNIRQQIVRLCHAGS